MALETPITIVGCGPGSEEYVTPAARRAVAKADFITGAPRLFDLFPECRAQRVPFESKIERLLEALASLPQDKRIVILVSGDPAIFSLTQNVVARFGRDRCSIIPAVGSVQLAFARVGLSWLGATILSAHGRTPDVTPGQLRAADRIAILAGTPEAIRWIAATAEALVDSHTVFLCQDLSLPTESVRQLSPDALGATSASSLSIILLIQRNLSR